MVNMSEFEKQVRHALIEKEMTVSDLARELGLSVSYVHDILTGKRKGEKQVERIKKFLSIDADSAYEEKQIDS